MGHRRRALLPFGKRLFHFADLGLLQAADLQCELLETGRGDRERAQQLGVAVALNHLRRHRIWLEPQAAADRRLDRRIEVRKRADGTGNHADPHAFARAAHALDRAGDVGVPQRQFQAEGHDLGVDAVRPPDHGRVLVLDRAGLDRIGKSGQQLEDDVARLDHLQGLRGINHVRGGEAEVQPAGRRADLLGHRGGEGNDVVLGDSFDFVDARDVEGALRPQVACGLGRNNAGLGHGFGGGNLDREPGFVPALVAPDATHFGIGVTSDHSSCQLSRSVRL